MSSAADTTLAAYRSHGPLLVRKAERILGSHADAQDIVQGLFMSMLQKSQTHTDLAYLYRAVNNRCLNWLRDRKKQRRLLEQHMAEGGSTQALADKRVITVDVLIKLTDMLDHHVLDVLIYRYCDGMNQEEIALVTGFSRRTVGKRLKRAHEAMKTVAGWEESA